MKGWVINQPSTVGSLAQDFRFADNLPIPEPEPEQVLVRTLFAPLHIDDIHIAEGSFLGGVPFMFPSLDAKNPQVLGSDVTGIVTKVGNKVTKLKEGDIIWGAICPIRERQGSWAEFCCVHEDYAVKKPTQMETKKFAASIFSLFVACGAIQPVEKMLKRKLVRQKRILIIGVSGCIGSLICKLLKKCDSSCTIIGVCSGINARTVKEKYGADEVIDYKNYHFKNVLIGEERKVDFVFDCVGGLENENGSYKVLRSGGVFVTVAGPVTWIGDTKLSWCEMMRLIFGLMWRFFRNIWTDHLYCISNPSYNETAPIYEAMGRISLDPILARLISFESEIEMINAIEDVRSHQVLGKVLIKIGDLV